MAEEMRELSNKTITENAADYVAYGIAEALVNKVKEETNESLH